MKHHLTSVLAVACLANFAVAADVAPTAAQDAAERRYADDRKLCADESSSSLRMQCLRDAKAEYDKTSRSPVSSSSNARAGDVRACLDCGKVLSVRLVEKEGEGSAVGMVAGGLAGALLGNQIGKGGTRNVATLVGAAGGAYAGNKIEQNAKSVRRWDVAVRFENGEDRTFSFDKDPGFNTGAEVRASGGSIIHR